MVTWSTWLYTPRSTAHHGNASVESVHENVAALPSTAKLAASSIVISTASFSNDKQSAICPFTQPCFKLVLKFQLEYTLDY